jgi:hypothetical protein
MGVHLAYLPEPCIRGTTRDQTGRISDMPDQQRIYLVIMDETEEATRALRFAARRAVRTGGGVHILALVPRQEFVAFAGSRPRSSRKPTIAPKCSPPPRPAAWPADPAWHR